MVKIAIDPVWYLPGIAERFGTTETGLRRTLFEQTAMFPELVTRPDLQVFLPPVGGMTVYLFGDIAKLGDPAAAVACRVHDECNGSDVFGSDICTCRPYLVHGIEECARAAQKGGLGIIVYNRKEGRALGEVPSSWSTMPASGKKAVMLPAPISNGPNASPACRTRAFSN